MVSDGTYNAEGYKITVKTVDNYYIITSTQLLDLFLIIPKKDFPENDAKHLSKFFLHVGVKITEHLAGSLKRESYAPINFRFFDREYKTSKPIPEHLAGLMDGKVRAPINFRFPYREDKASKSGSKKYKVCH